MADDLYSVYVHTNKQDGKKYIGLTNVLPDKRWMDGKGYKGQQFYKTIEDIGWDGFDHDVVLNGLTRHEAYSLESGLISKYRTHDPLYGYNSMPGTTVLDDQCIPSLNERITPTDAISVLGDMLFCEVDATLEYAKNQLN